ncbi:hypothetical protein KIN20_022698 [Parelaphostrongylus tenuis]|uniref:Uncharacterized protein n=1 Tax=Parelaphostrongylus tenuis TaxID=148309 RepID=A0AAD5MQM4_PARTN|nr:hypothetical protein KIN20_022698 [Parelaphostrongylus tenuis]
MISEREDSEEETASTPEADQGIFSEVQFPTDEHFLHKRSSSLLEDQQDGPFQASANQLVTSPRAVVDQESDENMLRQEPPARPSLPLQGVDEVKTFLPAKPNMSEGGHSMTQEELDRITWIQRLTKETLEVMPINSRPAAPPKILQGELREEDEPLSSLVDALPPVSTIPEREESEAESVPTPKADYRIASEVESLTEEHALYERLSPLLGYQHNIPSQALNNEHVPPPTSAGEQEYDENMLGQIPLPMPPLPPHGADQVEASSLVQPYVLEEEHLLTQEELDHISWIQRLAEETLKEKPTEAIPTAPFENLHEDIAIFKEGELFSLSVQALPDVSIIPERQQSEKKSEPTSGADEGISSETQPLTGEHTPYELPSPLLEDQCRTPSAALDDQHVPLPTLDVKQKFDESMTHKREPSWRALLLLQSDDKGEASPLGKTKVSTEELLLTQEELDRLTWIQCSAEETRKEKPNQIFSTAPVENKEGDLIIRTEDEPLSSSIQASPNLDINQEPKSEEEYKPKPGTDQGKVGSSTEEHDLYERSSTLPKDKSFPMLGDQRVSPLPQSVYNVEASPSAKISTFEEDHLSTQDDKLDHIAWIQRLAEETFEVNLAKAFPPAPVVAMHEEITIPKEDEVSSSLVQVFPNSNVTMEREQFKDESEPTSGADQGTSSEVESPPEEHALYERTSPLLEDHYDTPSQALDDQRVPSPAPVAEQETDENMVLEQQPPPRPPPPSKGEDKVDSFPLTKPSIFEEKHLLTQEELDHIARIQRLAEETLQVKNVEAPKSSSVESLRGDIASGKADELPSSSVQAFPSFNLTSEQEESKEESELTSGADQGTSSEIESPTEEHALHERTSPMLEDHYDTPSQALDDQRVPSPAPVAEQESDENMMLEQEPPPRPPPPSKGKDKVDSFPLTKPRIFEEEQLLTQEELDHIARIQRLAEETLEVKNVAAPKSSSVGSLRGDIASRKADESAVIISAGFSKL